MPASTNSLRVLCPFPPASGPICPEADMFIQLKPNFPKFWADFPEFIAISRPAWQAYPHALFIALSSEPVQCKCTKCLAPICVTISHILLAAFTTYWGCETGILIFFMSTTSLVQLPSTITSRIKSSSTGICSPFESLPAALISATVALCGSSPFTSQFPLACATMMPLSFVQYTSHSTPYAPTDIAYLSDASELAGKPDSAEPPICAVTLFEHAAGFISPSSTGTEGSGILSQSGSAGHLSLLQPAKSAAAATKRNIAILFISVLI